MSLIPLSDLTKGRCDIAAVTTAGLSFFKAIPWPELAAAAAFFYTVLRIVEVVIGWFKKGRVT